MKIEKICKVEFDSKEEVRAIDEFLRAGKVIQEMLIDLAENKVTMVEGDSVNGLSNSIDDLLALLTTAEYNGYKIEGISKE